MAIDSGTWFNCFAWIFCLRPIVSVCFVRLHCVWLCMCVCDTCSIFGRGRVLRRACIMCWDRAHCFNASCDVIFVFTIFCLIFLFAGDHLVDWNARNTLIASNLPIWFQINFIVWQFNTALIEIRKRRQQTQLIFPWISCVEENGARGTNVSRSSFDRICSAKSLPYMCSWWPSCCRHLHNHQLPHSVEQHCRYCVEYFGSTTSHPGLQRLVFLNI